MSSGDRTNSTRLCRLLGIDRPVLLAPMAGVAGGRLAAAVSNSGGLGFVGGGYGDLDSLDIQMELTKGTRVGIGFINWRISHDTIDAALAYDPAAIWLSFGDSGPFIPAIHAAGVLVVCQVFDSKEAVAMVRAGADVIVIQGNESGGHGKSGDPLASLVRAAYKAIAGTPLVAAGGVNNESDYLELVSLGAAGVALGTAYYATDEALDSAQAKQRLVEASSSDTVRGIVYDIVRGPEWPDEFDGRSLRTTMTDRWTGNESALRRAADSQAALHTEAAANNDMTIRVVWAGQGLDGINAVLPAAEITKRFPMH